MAMNLLFRCFRYVYNVALLIPVVLIISDTVQAFESYNFNASSIFLWSTDGRPPFRPLARAAAKPSNVRR